MSLYSPDHSVGGEAATGMNRRLSITLPLFFQLIAFLGIEASGAEWCGQINTNPVNSGASAAPSTFAAAAAAAEPDVVLSEILGKTMAIRGLISLASRIENASVSEVPGLQQARSFFATMDRVQVRIPMGGITFRSGSPCTVDVSFSEATSSSFGPHSLIGMAHPPTVPYRIEGQVRLTSPIGNAAREVFMAVLTGLSQLNHADFRYVPLPLRVLPV
ncbi:MAG: hypothetical protein C5B49_07260, partial [Bdellovibrio sp.]